MSENNIDDGKVRRIEFEMVSSRKWIWDPPKKDA
jgi:hypothetical protein